MRCGVCLRPTDRRCAACLGDLSTEPVSDQPPAEIQERTAQQPNQEVLALMGSQNADSGKLTVETEITEP